MIDQLIKLADKLDKLGMFDEADEVDRISTKNDLENKEDTLSLRIKIEEDGVATLFEDDASIVSEQLDLMMQKTIRINPLNNYDDEPEKIDPRLSLMVEKIEEAYEALYEANMQASHLRDGTGS